MTFDERHDDFGDEPVRDILERETLRELSLSEPAMVAGEIPARALDLGPVKQPARSGASEPCVEEVEPRLRRRYAEVGA